MAPEQPLLPTGVKSPSASLEEERPLKQQIDGGSSSGLVLGVDQRPYRFQPCLQHTCWRLLTAAKYAGCGVGGGGSTPTGFSKNQSWLCNNTRVNNCPAVGTEPRKCARSATGFQHGHVSSAGSKSSRTGWGGQLLHVFIIKVLVGCTGALYLNSCGA